MIECPSCGEAHMPGTLFCLECGSYLAAVEHVANAVGTAHAVQRIKAGPEAVNPLYGAPPLKLYLPRTRRTVTLSLEHEVRIGRTDPKRNVQPELDLSPEGGLEAGVSRLHAMIKRRDGGVVIIDLGSSNGTTVNGVELMPHVPQPLNDGDEIELGAFALRVYFEG